jgi:hypothetical protein
MKMVRALALDLAAWYAVPAAFLWIYVHGYMAPAEAVAPHLRIMLVPLVALAVLRLILAAFAPPRAARLASAMAAAALLWVMVAYYLLVLIGLQSWGRVVSWDIIASYAGQAGSFADALGISLFVVLGATLLLFLALFAGAWLYFGRIDGRARRRSAGRSRCSPESPSPALPSARRKSTAFAGIRAHIAPSQSP